MAMASRTGTIEAACLFFTVTVIITTVLRVISRTRSKAGLSWDDYLSFLAAIFAIGINCLGYVEAKHHLGQHIEVAGPQAALFYLKTLYANGLLSNACLTSVKLSVLCFYQRIFATTNRARWVLWIIVGLTIAWCISMEFVCALECIPVRAAWDPSIHTKTCINFLKFYHGAAGSKIVIDFMLLIFPVPFLWRLHMDWSRKVALTVTFLLGYLNPVFSFVRLAYLIRLGPKIFEADITWNYVDLTIWSIAECSVAVISAHIPSLQCLFIRFVRKAKQTTIIATKNAAQLDSDETDLVSDRIQVRDEGVFQRLQSERSGCGLRELPDQYGAFAYTRKHGTSDDGIELDSAVDMTARIHVSKTIDVVSSKNEGGEMLSVEHV